jgi:FAD/FMN-containing dehydrogenase
MTHVPEDMTVTVAAEVTLAALQAELGQRGQWLPVDPPGMLTVRQLLDTNASGPRRFGYGTIREHLLGIKVALPGGKQIKAGGQVVKNVAGYDLCKLFVGAGGELGTIQEAIFKLRPLPEAERFVQKQCATLEEAGKLIEMVLDSALVPVVLDLIAPATVIVGLAGTREEVEWQLEQLGWNEPATLDYSRGFPQKVSVLPSKLIETLRELKLKEFVARAGNGVIHYDGPPMAGGAPALQLQKRVREAFRG